MDKTERMRKIEKLIRLILNVEPDRWVRAAGNMWEYNTVRIVVRKADRISDVEIRLELHPDHHSLEVPVPLESRDQLADYIELLERAHNAKQDMALALSLDRAITLLGGNRPEPPSMPPIAGTERGPYR